jgi:hypothetical protein
MRITSDRDIDTADRLAKRPIVPLILTFDSPPNKKLAKRLVKKLRDCWEWGLMFEQVRVATIRGVTSPEVLSVSLGRHIGSVNARTTYSRSQSPLYNTHASTPCQLYVYVLLLTLPIPMRLQLLLHHMVNLQTLDVQQLKPKWGENTTLEYLPDDHQLQKLTLRVPSSDQAPDLLDQAPLLNNLIASPHLETITITAIQVDYSSDSEYQSGGQSAGDYDWELHCQLRDVIDTLNNTSTFTKLVINNFWYNDLPGLGHTKYLKEVCA